MKDKIIEQGYSFDDLLIVQQVSDVDSRYDSRMNLSTSIAGGVPEIRTPIIAANMDTVTEYLMAIAAAQFGGMGVIHRFMTPRDQAEQVRTVKAQMAIVESDPLVISESATVADALEMLNRKKRGYVLIIPNDGTPGQFLGIATNRDFKFGLPSDPITRIMTNREELHSVPAGTTQEQAVRFMRQMRIEKVPMVAENGSLVGVYTLKDDEMLNNYPNASKDKKGRLMVAAAIGIQPSDIERAHLLADAEVDAIVLDVAHGALRRVQEMIKTLKGQEHILIPIIAGNVSTEDTTKFLIDAGANGVKVGVGPGLVCDTRDVAGVGMPQVTAIMSAREAVEKSGVKIPIMADGGIRKPGDVSKAIAAGADSVMVGSILAGTLESPGEVVKGPDGNPSKMVRGMASDGAHRVREQIEGDGRKSRRVAEGNTKFVPVKGNVEEVLFQLEGGLRSGMSYTGAFTIAEMHERAQFVEVSAAGANEQRRPLK